jgi:hypothetical protein
MLARCGGSCLQSQHLRKKRQEDQGLKVSLDNIRETLFQKLNKNKRNEGIAQVV